jgi:hypothetical protein
LLFAFPGDGVPDIESRCTASCPRIIPGCESLSHSSDRSSIFPIPPFLSWISRLRRTHWRGTTMHWPHAKPGILHPPAPMSEGKSTSAAYRRMETHPRRCAFQWRASTSETIEPARRVYVSNQLPANLQTAQGSTNSTSPFSVIADLMMAHAGHCNQNREVAAQRLNEYPEFHVLVLDCRGIIARALAVEDAFSIANGCSCCILQDVGCLLSLWGPTQRHA